MGWKVGIVGAGFAGLIAARELERLGHEVEIFEARDRIGGRTWTTTENSLDYPLEMGGTWVHWMQPYVWAEMQRYEAEMIVSPFVDKAYWFVNNEVRTGTEEELDGKLGEIQAKVFEGSREFFPFPHDPDFVLRDPDIPEEVKERYRAADETPVLAGLDGFSDEERALADSYWRAGYQGSSEKASSLMAKHWAALSDHRLSLLDDQTLRYKLKDGMKGIYEKIAADVHGPIHLSTPIDAVVHHDRGATLTLSHGTTREFDAVVVTIPAGALGNVSFSPGLPTDVQKIVDSKWGCTGFKIWIKVEGHKNVFAYGDAGHPIAMIRSEYFLDDGTTIMVGFGPDHTELDGEDVAEVNRIVKEWDPELEVVGSTWHNWQEDEWSGQTWTTPALGQFAAAKPHDLGASRLVLAGSDWAAGWNSFVDGAIETGYRAANKINSLARKA